MADETPERPLSGIRVIDMTRILAGPFCTMNLGDMGAEIIKIEQPGKGDDTRSWGPPFAGSEAAYFLGVNRNKKSVTLNLKEERGLGILKTLIKGADVLIENFKAGTLEKWGLTRDWMEKNAPQVVHTQITGYGEKGPKAGMPGYDFLLQAESGLMAITGEEGGSSMKLGVAIVDVCTGMYAAMSILGALNARTRTGKGQKTSVTLYDSALSALVNVASNYLISGDEACRYGNGHPNIVPYRDFVCGKGDIALAVGNDMQFARLANLLGHPEWVEDEKYKTNPNRVRNRAAVDTMVRDALSSDSAENWITRLQEAGIPCSMVNPVGAALDSEQTKANDMIEEIEHPTAGLIKMLGIPYRFSDTPAGVSSAPPELGADTDAVLVEIGGVLEAELETLRGDGVI
ncbi:MAG: CoA transferase [Rhodospirillaceae bacterium]|nr:CoA transferase [Rhodospirillaceae bacterium]